MSNISVCKPETESELFLLLLLFSSCFLECSPSKEIQERKERVCVCVLGDAWSMILEILGARWRDGVLMALRSKDGVAMSLRAHGGDVLTYPKVQPYKSKASSFPFGCLAHFVLKLRVNPKLLCLYVISMLIK